MEKLKDLEIYINRMSKSMPDKLFFVDKICADVFIDFGCADGTLLRAVKNLYPDSYCVGYDINDDMLEKAREGNGDILFTSKWDHVKGIVFTTKGTKALILSSIIHEVYSYGTFDDVKTFWDRVFDSGFDYIIVRDMMLSDSADRFTSLENNVKIHRNPNWETLYDFTNIWGGVERNTRLIHYLLKYRYLENWEREVRENYLPITREDFLSSVPENYSFIYNHHYILPYLYEIVKKDFNISLKDNTHVKFILKKE